MSDLHQAVEDYIAVRRALGSKLERRTQLLQDFVAYLQAAGATTVTTELALAWATLPGEDAHPAYLSNRLCAVRGFARHLQAFNPATEVPPGSAAPLAEMPGRPLPVLRRRHRSADDGRPFGHPSASRRHLRSADRDPDRDRHLLSGSRRHKWDVFTDRPGRAMINYSPSPREVLHTWQVSAG